MPWDQFGGGRMPSHVAAEFEARRKRLGMSQRELGHLVGVKQPQIANVMRGHGRLGRRAAARLREVLAAA